ncbi:MAG: hypothetical protein ACYCYE_07975 [Clostridia bacterium]
MLILSQIGVFGLIMSGGIVDGDGDYRMPFEIDWASLLTASTSMSLGWSQPLI